MLPLDFPRHFRTTKNHCAKYLSLIILLRLFSGQQQTFRPFFDTRFTSTVGLLDFRRKSDPFSNVGNETGSGYDHWSGYNNYSYLGYNPGTMGVASSYNPAACSLASYGTAVLDPLLQASSLASAATAASAQTTSGMQRSKLWST